MDKNRKRAILVALFFILGVATLFIGEAFYDSIVSSPDYLDNMYPNRISIMFGILIELAGYLGLLFIPILLYPILKKHNQVLAMGYIGIRLFEVILLALAQTFKLSLIPLSRDYLKSGGSDVSYFQNTGESIKSIYYWINGDGLIYLIVFGIGAIILYSLLLKSKLIPRWLSIWGLIAGVSIILATLVHNFELSTTLAFIFMLPIAVQEQVMAVWLIVKGFNPSAIECKSAGQKQPER